MKNAAFCITGLALQGLSMSLMAQTDKPNIVIIMTDQQRADLCGREGFPLDVTPYVDQLAQENVWFNKAYTVAPASSPARCSMFTGRFPSATHVRTNHNIPDIFFEQDLVGVLKENGYKTALVGKNHAYLKPADLDFWSEYGHWGKNKKTTPEEKETARFLNQKARGQWLEPSPIPVEEQHPTKIVNETLSWIEKQKENPFFVWVSFPEPHNPYQVCEPYYSMFSPDKLPAVHVAAACHTSPAKIGNFVINLYAGRTGFINDAHDIFLTWLRTVQCHPCIFGERSYFVVFICHIQSHQRKSFVSPHSAFFMYAATSYRF